MTKYHDIWKCVANLGDKHPLDHGGLFVMIDTTGEYDPVIESIQPVECNGLVEWERHWVSLDKCYYTNQVISDNKYHLDCPAWFADSLQAVCESAGMGIEKDGLIALLCSDDPVQRAQGYRMVLDYHGWSNGDPYPYMMNRREAKERLKRSGIPKILDQQ